MRIIDNPDHHAAIVILAERDELYTIEVADNVLASMDADDTLVGLDLMDTRQFGTPFDAAAAERALAWVRERLTLDAVS